MEVRRQGGDAVIGDIQKAITAYRRLTTAERRLFRDEVGLRGPRDGVRRKRRLSRKPRPDVPADVAPRVRAPRKAKAIAAAEAIPTGTVQ